MWIAHKKMKRPPKLMFKRTRKVNRIMKTLKNWLTAKKMNVTRTEASIRIRRTKKWKSPLTTRRKIILIKNSLTNRGRILQKPMWNHPLTRKRRPRWHKIVKGKYFPVRYFFSGLLPRIKSGICSGSYEPVGFTASLLVGEKHWNGNVNP